MRQILLGLFLVPLILHAQVQLTRISDSSFLTNAVGSEYQFTIIKSMDPTATQDQNSTGTCWSFSSLSFFESEILRTNGKKVNLSEMFVAYNTYLGKADKYVRTDGHTNFDEGGAFHDTRTVFKINGIVPETEYTGLLNDDTIHNHSAMITQLKSYMNTLKDHNNLTRNWKDGLKGILNANLGVPPTEFTVDGVTYTPKSYSNFLGLNMDNYVSLTSFSNHEFYSECKLAIPDNWAWESSYNLPLNFLLEVAFEAIDKGYTFAWGADVSENGWNPYAALAIVPENNSAIKVVGRDKKSFNDAGAIKKGNQFLVPSIEKTITQENRQIAYDMKETTDDHGMHAVGYVKDQNGTRYFIIKNSWGTDYNSCNGYILVSEHYFAYKTINIFLHKEAINKELLKKLKI